MCSDLPVVQFQCGGVPYLVMACSPPYNVTHMHIPSKSASSGLIPSLDVVGVPTRCFVVFVSFNDVSYVHAVQSFLSTRLLLMDLRQC